MHVPILLHISGKLLCIFSQIHLLKQHHHYITYRIYSNLTLNSLLLTEQVSTSNVGFYGSYVRHHYNTAFSVILPLAYKL